MPSEDGVMFVVNPNSQGGRTKKLWQKYHDIIASTFEIDWQYSMADTIGSGITAAENAIENGYTTLIGVGGEGTINEVLNGAYQQNQDFKLGFIRSGTSNDFLSKHVYQWPKHVEEQLQTIQSGSYWLGPLTQVDADYTRYSLNLADTGVSAMVSYESSVKGKLNWIKGGMRYYILALLNVYKWRNIPAEIYIDNEFFDGDLTMLVAGFSKQLGDYLALPQAQLFGDKLAYMIVRDFSRLKILGLMTKVKKGKHDNSIDGIDMGYCNTIQINAERPPLFEVDGEPYSKDTKNITISAKPKSVRLIAHNWIKTTNVKIYNN